MLVKLLVYCDLVKHVLEPLLDDKSMLSGVGVLSKSFRSLAMDYTCIRPYPLMLLGYVKHRKFTAVNGKLSDFRYHAENLHPFTSFGITRMHLDIDVAQSEKDMIAFPRGINHVEVTVRRDCFLLNCFPENITTLTIRNNRHDLTFIGTARSVKHLHMSIPTMGIHTQFPSLESLSTYTMSSIFIPKTVKRVFAKNLVYLERFPASVTELHITGRDQKVPAHIPSHIKLLTVAGYQINLRKRKRE